MKKMIGVCLMLLCIGLLSGCSQKTDADISTVFIEKKGKIVSVDVEALDKDYYDADELEKYITEHLEEYTEENGGAVKKVSFDVMEDTAKLKMQYDSYEDYQKFNGIEFYSGTAVKAQAEGYDFDTEFYSVADGKKDKKADREEVLSDDDNKVAVIKANIDVCVPGRILFVSAQDTEIKAEDTVSINSEGANEEAALTYIIYK